jgi:hypothetical protein
MTQHAALSAERWAEFDIDQQILMIGNEMNRASRFVAGGDPEGLRRGYERVLRLADLTAAGRPRRALLRELLRWRELVAGLYQSETLDAALHRAAFRALLQMTPTASRQIPYLVPRDR